MKRLEKSQIAPEFQAQDIYNETVEFSHDTENWTFLSFHRFAACPFCNLRTKELIDHNPEFRRFDIDVISIWPSSETNMKKYVGQNNVPFPLVVDPGKKIYKTYGVTSSSKLSALRMLSRPGKSFKALKNSTINITVDSDPTLLPANFLVNPYGKVVIAYYGKDYDDHVPVSEILSSVKSVPIRKTRRKQKATPAT